MMKRVKVSYTFEFMQRDGDGRFCDTVADAMLVTSALVINGQMSNEATGRKPVFVHSGAAGAVLALPREVTVSWVCQIEGVEHGTADNG